MGVSLSKSLIPTAGGGGRALEPFRTTTLVSMAVAPWWGGMVTSIESRRFRWRGGKAHRLRGAGTDADSAAAAAAASISASNIGYASARDAKALGCERRLATRPCIVSRLVGDLLCSICALCAGRSMGLGLTMR